VQHTSLRWAAGWVASGAAAGAIAGRLLPPFAIDEPFWRSFLTSSGLGGVAAFLAAVVAFSGVAYSSRRVGESARRDRDQRTVADARQHFWERFTWAAERAVEPDRSELGLSVLVELIDQKWVTIDDNRVALAVTRVIVEGPSRSDDSSISNDGGAQ
jgi:hypothetical protein